MGRLAKPVDKAAGIDSLSNLQVWAGPVGNTAVVHQSAAALSGDPSAAA